MEGEELQVIEDGDMEDWLKVTAALLFVDISGQYQPLGKMMCRTVCTTYVVQCLICICIYLFMSLSRCVTRVVRWGMFLSVMCTSCVCQTPLSWTVLSAPPPPLGIKRGQRAEVSSTAEYISTYMSHASM